MQSTRLFEPWGTIVPSFSLKEWGKYFRHAACHSGVPGVSRRRYRSARAAPRCQPSWLMPGAVLHRSPRRLQIGWRRRGGRWRTGAGVDRPGTFGGRRPGRVDGGRLGGGHRLQRAALSAGVDRRAGIGRRRRHFWFLVHVEAAVIGLVLDFRLGAWLFAGGRGELVGVFARIKGAVSPVRPPRPPRQPQPAGHCGQRHHQRFHGFRLPPARSSPACALSWRQLRVMPTGSRAPAPWRQCPVRSLVTSAVTRWRDMGISRLPASTICAMRISRPTAFAKRLGGGDLA